MTRSTRTHLQMASLRLFKMTPSLKWVGYMLHMVYLPVFPNICY